MSIITISMMEENNTSVEGKKKEMKCFVTVFSAVILSLSFCVGKESSIHKL